MEDNKIWRVDNLEYIHDDSETEDSEIDESKTDENDDDEEDDEEDEYPYPRYTR